MKYVDLSPEQLKKLLAAKWEVVGFQGNVSPSDLGEASETDGYAFLLKQGTSLAIVTQGHSGPELYMRILFLTGEHL